MINQKFLEKGLGESIVDITPVDTVSKDATKDRSAFLLSTSSGHRYFLKYYSNATFYNREISGLRQFGGKISPELVYEEENQNLLITKYVDFNSLGPKVDRKIVERIIEAFEISLSLKSDRLINHKENLNKYLGEIRKVYPELAKKIEPQKIVGSINIQPKSGCHGDLHPRNIMVTKDKKVFITDFESACFDTPLIDAIRFCFGPDLPISLKERFRILDEFINVLSRKFEFTYSPKMINDTITYWATTCLGFYVSFCPAESIPKKSKYNHILNFCIKILNKLN